MPLIEFLETTSGAVAALSVVITGISSASVFSYKLYRKTKIIYQQITPNGGSSLADVINQIRQHQRIGEMRLRVVWENMAQGYYECDDQGAKIFVNKRLCEKFGLSAFEMSGTGWMRALVSQAERDRVSEEWFNSIENNIPYDSIYKIRNQRTGEIVKIRSQAWPCKDKNGKTIWIFGTSEEVQDE